LKEAASRRDANDTFQAVLRALVCRLASSPVSIQSLRLFLGCDEAERVLELSSGTDWYITRANALDTSDESDQRPRGVLVKERHTLSMRCEDTVEFGVFVEHVPRGREPGCYVRVLTVRLLLLQHRFHSDHGVSWRQDESVAVPALWAKPGNPQPLRGDGEKPGEPTELSCCEVRSVAGPVEGGYRSLYQQWVRGEGPMARSDESELLLG